MQVGGDGRDRRDHHRLVDRGQEDAQQDAGEHPQDLLVGEPLRGVAHAAIPFGSGGTSILRSRTRSPSATPRTRRAYASRRMRPTVSGALRSQARSGAG